MHGTVSNACSILSKLDRYLKTVHAGTTLCPVSVNWFSTIYWCLIGIAIAIVIATTRIQNLLQINRSRESKANMRCVARSKLMKYVSGNEAIDMRRGSPQCIPLKCINRRFSNIRRTSVVNGAENRVSDMHQSPSKFSA